MCVSLFVISFKGFSPLVQERRSVVNIGRGEMQVVWESRGRAPVIGLGRSHKKLYSVKELRVKREN